MRPAFHFYSILDADFLEEIERFKSMKDILIERGGRK